MIIKPITTEKAVRMIEIDNTLTFRVDVRANKEQIKKDIEKLFSVKVEKINVLKRDNNKIAYVRLDKKNPAIDVATKLGMI